MATHTINRDRECQVAKAFSLPSAPRQRRARCVRQLIFFSVKFSDSLSAEPHAWAAPLSHHSHAVTSCLSARRQHNGAHSVDGKPPYFYEKLVKFESADVFIFLLGRTCAACLALVLTVLAGAMDTTQTNKRHHAPHSGSKADKKSLKKKDKQDPTKQQSHNPRAHAINSVNRARRTIAHKMEMYASLSNPAVADTQQASPPHARSGRQSCSRPASPRHCGCCRTTQGGQVHTHQVRIVLLAHKVRLMFCRSLVKRFTKQNVGEIKGPITVVSGKSVLQAMYIIYIDIIHPGKNRRLTFFECNNDLNSMMDIAKIADLV